MRAILMFHNCEGQSQKTVSIDHNFFLFFFFCFKEKGEPKQIREQNTGMYQRSKFRCVIWNTMPLSIMYLSRSLCTLCLLAFQVRVTESDPGLCCCSHVTSFDH